MRKQYHFKKSDNGFFAWDVDNLITKSKSLPTFKIALYQIKEFDSNYWYQHESDIPTCRSITEHLELIHRCDLAFPIILAADGTIMDGMHRVCKAYFENRQTIKAVQFPKTPAPDFENVSPEDLPY